MTGANHVATLFDPVSKIESVADGRDLARRRVPKSVLQMFEAGSGSNITADANVDAFELDFSRSRNNVFQQQNDISTTVLGHDLAADPGELRNIGGPSHPDYDERLVAAMLKKLVALVDHEVGPDELPFDLTLFGTREVRYRPEDVQAGVPAGARQELAHPGTHVQPEAED